MVKSNISRLTSLEKAPSRLVHLNTTTTLGVKCPAKLTELDGESFEDGEDGEVEQDCDEALHSLQTGLASPTTKQNQDRAEIFPSLCSTVYT